MTGQELYQKLSITNIENIDDYIVYHYKKIFNVIKTAVENEKLKPNDFYLFMNYYIIHIMSAIKILPYKDYSNLINVLKFQSTTEQDYLAACNNVVNGDDNTKQLLDNLLSNVTQIYFESVKEFFEGDSDYADALADFTVLLYFKLYTRKEVDALFNSKMTLTDSMLQFAHHFELDHFENRIIINDNDDYQRIKNDIQELLSKYTFVYARIFSGSHINHVTKLDYNDFVFTKIDLGVIVNEGQINKIEIVLRYTSNFKTPELEIEEELKKYFDRGRLLILDSTKNTVDYRLTYVLNLLGLGTIKYAYDGLDDDPYIKLNITDELYFEDPISGNQFKEQLITKFNRVPLKEAKYINSGVIKVCKKNKIDYVFDVENADEFNAADNAYSLLQQIFIKYNNSK